jgi:hypothetical protein
VLVTISIRVIIALIMEAAIKSETSVMFYQTSRRNNPEDTHLLNVYAIRFCFISILFKLFCYSIKHAETYICVFVCFSLLVGNIVLQLFKINHEIRYSYCNFVCTSQFLKGLNLQTRHCRISVEFHDSTSSPPVLLSCSFFTFTDISAQWFAPLLRILEVSGLDF